MTRVRLPHSCSRAFKGWKRCRTTASGFIADFGFVAAIAWSTWSMILAVDHGLRRKTKFDQAVARVLESGWGTPTPAEIKARQQAIIAQADLLDKFADSSLSAMVRDQL